MATAPQSPVYLESPMAGVDGRTVLGGARAPTDDDGRNGDFWVDEASKDFYGPKDGSGWSLAFHLNGDAGWSPVIIPVTDGIRRIFRVVDWVGGGGTKPTTGSYLGASGWVSAPADALDILSGTGWLTTAKIADGAVTLAKMDGGTANKVIGFDADGDPVEKSVGLPELASSVYAPPGTARSGASSTTLLSPLAAINILHSRYPHLWDYVSSNPETVTDFNAALTAALADRYVTLPALVPFTGTVVQPTPARGAGFGGTLESVIQPNGGTANCFEIGDGTTPVEGLRFDKFRLWPSAARTGGFAMLIRKAASGTGFTAVQLGTAADVINNGNVHRLWGGLYLDEFGEVTLDGLHLASSGLPLAVNGNLDGQFGVELTVDGGTMIYGGAVGVTIGGGAGGIYFGRVNFSLCQKNIRVTKDFVEKENAQIFLGPHCTSDLCDDTGIDIEGGSCTDFRAAATWLASCQNASGANLVVRANDVSGIVPRIQLAGIRSFNSVGKSLIFLGGETDIEGGMASTGSADGILIGAGAIVRARGMTVKDFTDGTALTVEAGAVGYFEDGSFSGNDVDVVNSAPTTFRVRRNVGYVTENTVTASIPIGSSYVDIPHGLDITPELKNVTAVPLSSLPNSGIAGWWCSAADATNIRLNLNDNVVTAAVNFSVTIKS